MKAIILLAALGSLILAVLSNPAYTLAGVILLYPMEQLIQSTLPFFVSHSYALNLIIAEVIGISVVRRALFNSYVFRDIPKVYYLILFLYFYAGLSTQWTIDPSLTLGIFLTKLPYIFVFVLAFPLIVKDSLDLSKSFQLLLIIGVILALVTIFLVDWDVRRIVLEGESGNKTTGNPLEIARFSGELALVSLLTGLRQKSLFKKALSLLAILLSLLIIIKSGTRGQLIAVLLVMGLFSIKFNSMKSAVMLAVAGAALSYLVSYGLELYWGDHSRWSSERMEGAIDERLENIKILAGHWASSPFTMIFGLGNSASYHPSILGFYPHNMAVEILCEEGIIGMVTFLAIQIITVKSFVKARKSATVEQRSLFSLFIYSMILSFKQGSMVGNFSLFMYCIIVQRVFNEKKAAP